MVLNRSYIYMHARILFCAKLTNALTKDIDEPVAHEDPHGRAGLAEHTGATGEETQEDWERVTVQHVFFKCMFLCICENWPILT